MDKTGTMCVTTGLSVARLLIALMVRYSGPKPHLLSWWLITLQPLVYKWRSLLDESANLDKWEPSQTAVRRNSEQQPRWLLSYPHRESCAPPQLVLCTSTIIPSCRRDSKNRCIFTKLHWFVTQMQSLRMLTQQINYTNWSDQSRTSRTLKFTNTSSWHVFDL